MLGVRFSPDGQLLVSGGNDHTARLIRVSDGTTLAVLRGHLQAVTDVAFSPDGQRVATASADNTIKIWNAAGGGLQRTLSGHGGTVWSVIFGRDGQSVFSAGSDGKVKNWRLADGVAVNTFLGAQVPGPIALAPDGARLASGSGYQGGPGGLTIWDAATGLVARRFSERTIVVAFSGDGSRLAAAGDVEARLMQRSDGKVLRRFSSFPQYVSNVALSPDASRVVTGNSDQTATIWNADSGMSLHYFDNHAHGMAVSPDGGLLALSHTEGNTALVGLWRMSDGARVGTLAPLKTAPYSMAFSPDGSLLATAGIMDAVRVWRVADGALVRTLEAGTAVDFLSDGSLLATGDANGRTVHLWRTTDWSLARTFDIEGGSAAVALSPDGQYLVTGGGSGMLHLWAVADGRSVGKLAGHGDAIGSLRFSPDGSVLASGSFDDGLVRLWCR